MKKQHMVFQQGEQTGLAKGLKAVCTERFGEAAVKGKLFRNIKQFISNSVAGLKQDELAAMLRKEEDFKQVKPILQERLEALGCKVVFGVKFHPEFIMIDNVNGMIIGTSVSR